MMGGNIWLDSEPDQGSTFGFTARFKIGRADKPSKESPPSLTRPVRGKAVSGRPAGLRVLVAEDNPVNQKVSVRLLEKLGCQTIVANNGKEVLVVLENEAVDLVIMDIQMPEMDGLETTARIRAREKRIGRHIPIVAMTAYAMKGDMERCLESGMDVYLAKPISLEQLRQVIEQVMTTDRSANGPG